MSEEKRFKKGYKVWDPSGYTYFDDFDEAWRFCNALLSVGLETGGVEECLLED